MIYQVKYILLKAVTKQDGWLDLKVVGFVGFCAVEPCEKLPHLFC